MNKYEDIINIYDFNPKYYKRMSVESRAFQFAPFSALTGYYEAIYEKQRLTYTKKEILEDSKNVIDYKLKIIFNNIMDEPKVIIKYFIKDKIKSGGNYEKIVDNVIKIDNLNKKLILKSNKEISFDSILDIKSQIFDVYE